MGVSRKRRRATRAVVCLLTVLAAVLGAAGPAAAELAVGIGDQKPEMFTDPRFADLRIRQVRRVVAWDALEITWQRRELDEWMHAARAAGVNPLIAFARSRRPQLTKFLPTPGRLGRTFDKFRDRYGWVHTFTPWNEANTTSQPTGRSPRMAALYYNELRRRCPDCTIVAADVLDTDNMVPWLEEFLLHTDGVPQLWGLHNYLDANRFRTTGTRAMLAAVPGEIWFTEVGGIVLRRARGKKLSLGPESPSHAARVMTWLFQLAELDPRIRRLYLYHWNSERGPGINWDSGLIDPHGEPRPAFRVLLRHLLRLRALSERPRR